MKKDFTEKIIEILIAAKKQGTTLGKIMQELDLQKKSTEAVKDCLERLRKMQIVGINKERFYLRDAKKIFRGTISYVSSRHGFVKKDDVPEEAFIRGRDLLGAIPGDKVIAKIVAEKDEFNRSDTAVIACITEPFEGVLTGIVNQIDGKFCLTPCGYISTPLKIRSYSGLTLHENDRVRYKIVSRSEHHSDHVVDITSIYGSSEKASVAVEAYFEEHNIPTEFSPEALAEAAAIADRGVLTDDFAGRVDLRHLPIFTIDGADTKDIDDAVSIERSDSGYLLGVHIADVSHYVSHKSAIFKDAFARGTSVYVADKVIPMLPKELSNGVCSLNPNEDRLAFSCLMKVKADGTIDTFAFKKSVIRSRVKGVYSEINQILQGGELPHITEKYHEVSAQIPLLKELATILIANRIARGAPEIETTESKIVCNENGECVDVIARSRGFSEEIIEECMLMANSCAARVAMKNEYPFVYRVHEAPTAEKMKNLADTLTLLGIEPIGVSESNRASVLANILKTTKDDKRYPIINKIVLRTMMKAKYSEEPLGHYGLVMKEYAHFTSPIRRIADLSIHKILSTYGKGNPSESTVKRFTKYAAEASLKATARELVAVTAERDCVKNYMAEYMKSHLGETYQGVISGVINDGIFVELPSGVEGRIGLSGLPSGVFEMKNNIILTETLSGEQFTLGDSVTVLVAAVNVGFGRIDFNLVKHETEAKK